MIFNALTIAGSDSGGGAGIQADLKTFSALGVFGVSVVTALTAQNTHEVRSIFEAPPEFVAAQIAAVLEDIEVAATKIGMLSRVEVIETVAAGIDEFGLENVVLDPVMVAKSGDKLLADEAISAIESVLMPLVSLVTPNLPEASALTGLAVARNEDEMLKVAEKLLSLGARGVLLKGGHLEGAECSDLLHDGEQAQWLRSPRVHTRNTHGTGCTLSSAITAGLAKGFALSTAVGMAKQYLNGAIVKADELRVGSGHGPVHHFYRAWPVKDDEEASDVRFE